MTSKKESQKCLNLRLKGHSVVEICLPHMVQYLISFQYSVLYLVSFHVCFKYCISPCYFFHSVGYFRFLFLVIFQLISGTGTFCLKKPIVTLGSMFQHSYQPSFHLLLYFHTHFKFLQMQLLSFFRLIFLRHVYETYSGYGF